MKPTPQQLANRATWLAALRSGEYQQARRVLHRPGVGYCCLGVGAQCAGVERIDTFEDFGSSFAFGPHESRLRPPSFWFADQYGVSERWAMAIIETAINLNDRGHRFDTIADRLSVSFSRADEGEA
jgi:hypothetical protein